MTVRSPRDERFGFAAQGSFRVRFGNEQAMLILLAVLVPVGFVASYMLTIGYTMANYPYNKAVMQVPFYSIVFLVLAVIWGLLCKLAYNVITMGKEYYYKADEKGFVVQLENAHGERYTDALFLYENVSLVSYRPLYLLKRHRGFHVMITNKGRKYTYDYIFPKTKLYRSTESSPFFIIEEMAGLRKNTELM